MGCLLALVLIAALALAGAGFAVHLLWIFAVVFFFCWVAGYAFGRGQRRGGRRRR
jgi:multisubunit Na+/H+ antiporter MnhG subunit